MIPHLCPASLKTLPGWTVFAERIADYHRFPKAEIRDSFLGPGEPTLLSRAAWIEGLGFGVKSVTVCPRNKARRLPSVQGMMTLFDSETGTPLATLDSDLVTGKKTAADSVLGARLLARPSSRVLLIVGAGVVAQTLISAYPAVLPSISSILIWNRTAEKAKEIAACTTGETVQVRAVTDLAEAVAQADIISSATLSQHPILQGDWVRPGTHVDLIGAYKADMREADDRLLQKARLFVDSRDTTLAHIGELLIPLRIGVITPEDIIADLYDLTTGTLGRQKEEDITLFKNGGGAHLDLMVARILYDSFIKEKA